VLLKNQTVAADNGVYLAVASGTGVRAADWPVGQDMVGYAVRAYEGTANANTVWAVYAQPAVVGTNDPQFIKHERNGA
jgi:hypothetical protein